MKKRVCALLLAACLLLCTACKSKSVVMTYDKVKLTEGMYQYFFASTKQYYLDTYSDLRDDAEFWDSEAIGGKTYAEYFDAEIRSAIEEFVISAALYDAYGFVISDEAAEQIEAVYQNAVTVFGSEDALATALKQMNMTTDDLRTIYTMQYKYERMLFDSGIAQVDDAAREKYYQERYACVKMIFIGTSRKFAYGEDGEKLYDANGLVTTPLTEEEKQSKLATADALGERLASDPDSFDTLYTDEQTNELDVSVYPNGLYICADNLYESGIQVVADAAFHIDIGDYVRLSDENGVYFVKRTVLPAKGYENDEYSQLAGLDELCSRYLYMDAIDQRLPALTVNEEKIAQYSVKTVQAVTY